LSLRNESGSPRRPKRPKRGSELRAEQLRLLPRGEVSAFVYLVEVDQVAIVTQSGPFRHGAHFRICIGLSNGKCPLLARTPACAERDVRTRRPERSASLFRRPAKFALSVTLYYREQAG
jgi:hypothetical protein